MDADLQMLTAPDPERTAAIMVEHRALWPVCFHQELGDVGGRLGPVGYTLVFGLGGGAYVLVLTDLDLTVRESKLALSFPTQRVVA